MMYFNSKSCSFVVDSPIRNFMAVNMYATLIIHYALYMCIIKYNIGIKFVIDDPNYPGHFYTHLICNRKKEEGTHNSMPSMQHIGIQST